MCTHEPPCPAATAPDAPAAAVIAAHPEQGWSLLCNGVITFDDNGELLPDNRMICAHDGHHEPAPVVALTGSRGGA